MNFDAFKKSLQDKNPPKDIPDTLTALWWDAKGNWDKAHKVAQDVNNSDGAWVHAYLHRKEGDEGNASYWYHQTGKAKSRLSFNEEWEEVVRALLKGKS